jgi:hypothetical protein
MTAVVAQEPSEPTREPVGLSASLVRSELEQRQGSYSIPKRESFAELPADNPSILRQRPWHDDFVPRAAPASPGEGRLADFTTPGETFQNPGGRRTAARFDSGGRPNRSEQLQSQMVGIQRYSALQSHIDKYGTPRFGFGMGFGMGW